MNIAKTGWIAVLIGIGLLASDGYAQGVITLAVPETLTFENGYDIVDQDGNFIKRIEGRSDATVQAYVDVNGIRYFMSDWSLKRSQEGHSPNWMKPIPAPTHAPMANRVSQEEADRIAANTPKYTPPQQQEPTRLKDRSYAPVKTNTPAQLRLTATLTQYLIASARKQ